MQNKHWYYWGNWQEKTQEQRARDKTESLPQIHKKTQLTATAGNTDTDWNFFVFFYNLQ